MELTLKKIIEKVDEIHRQVDANNDIINFMKNKRYILELQNMEKQIKSVYLKVSNILHISDNNYKCMNMSYIQNQKSDNKTDNKTDKNSCIYLNRTITNTSPSRDIAHNIPVNVKIVKNIDEIPNTPLYWVSGINQFAMHINGVVFRGNIGNIYNKNSIQTEQSTNQTVICKNRNQCKYLLGDKICKFYHDPHDLMQLSKQGKLSKYKFKKYRSLSRNFINTSWIYTDLPRNKKNALMRHFGSRNTLKNEFDLIKINNSKLNEIIIDNYRQQTLHDILVILGMNQYGLLKEYPDLNIRTGFYDHKNSYSLLSKTKKI